MKIGFLYTGEPTDMKFWSGTVSRLYSTISESQKLEVKKIIVTPSRLSPIVYKLIRLFSLKKNELSYFFNYIDSDKANRIIRKSDCDIIFAPACSKLIYSGRKSLRNKKLIYLSDTTYHNLQGYYFNHSLHDQRIGNKWEKTALELASAIIFPSVWSCDDAINYYHTPRERISLIRFGANMDDYGSKVVKAGQSKYKLLLVGVDYVRKGVDIAIETVKLLNKPGSAITFELSVVGLDRPETDIPDYVKFYGRLKKNNSEELKKLIDLYSSHDIFIMPTKAECAGIVFAEAAMFGLPSFTYATGGTPDYVEDGVTGRCLSPTCGAEEFCEAIELAVANGKIEEFSKEARRKYENELNWKFWREKFERVIMEMI